ncbi:MULTISPECIES: peroxiredoxin family protein [Solibacillus]|uniref:TlpA family protein disulfide reductase n=1 Tax=Solibacillus merdavium TaxID=2762218 RepID=A0ABR8XKN7_9BACL|nr:TlpA disulfide reductase family protein [Solibacillus merdavium]MBD8032488.1 TlpA family protein disulfide reductase [Solibacillus merdavium]
MKKYIGLAIITLLIGILIWENSMSTNENLSKATNEDGSRVVKATDFTLQALDHQQHSLSNSQGKWTIVNFWASWCEPCKMEAPHLQRIYEEYNDQLEILAVNMTKKDTPKDVQEFVNRYGLTFPVLLDEQGDVSMTYGAFTIPTTIFIDEKGNIKHEFVGPMEESFIIDLLSL